MAAHFHTADAKLTGVARVGQRQRPDSVGSLQPVADAGSRADARFPPEPCHARACADVALFHVRRRRAFNRVENVLRFDVPADNVVEEAIVALPYNGVERVDARVGACQEVHQRVGNAPGAQSPGQGDGSLDYAQLLDLQKADRLAEPVQHVHGRGNLVPEQVALVGHDYRNARTHRPTADPHGATPFYQSRVAHGHTLDVSYRVVLATGEKSKLQPQFGRAGSSPRFQESHTFAPLHE